jgi:hypothetical protein
MSGEDENGSGIGAKHTDSVDPPPVFFNFDDWIHASKITDAGRKKLVLNAIVDFESIVFVTDRDIQNIKLAAGDRSKFERQLKTLREGNPEVCGIQVTPDLQRSRPTEQVSQAVPVVEIPRNTAQVVGASLPEGKTSFSLEEVAAFIAGGNIPPNVQVEVNRSHALPPTDGVATSPSWIQPPSVGSSNLVAAFEGLNLADNRGLVQNGVYSRQQPISQAYPLLAQGNSRVPTSQDARLQPISQAYPLLAQDNSHFGSSSGVPVSQDARLQPISQAYPLLAQDNFQFASPSRLAYPQLAQVRAPSPSCLAYPQLAQGNSRESCLPIYSAQNSGSASRQNPWSPSTDVFGRNSLKDLLGINDCQQTCLGELFLPVNFCSHVRGSRSEEEELLSTPGGSKLVWTSNSNKKITPEKLSHGLFLGANARILARIVPNLTPELAMYLDYLRQLGDLLLNYTSTSVYCLDHEHRYEVAEKGRPWNEINSSLSLNWLKKKDMPNLPSSGTSARVSNRPNSLYARNAAGPKSQIICYLYNQPEGCPFGAGCRFVHKCSVENCPESHPATKHTFRGSKPTTPNVAGQGPVQNVPSRA